jgi:hypothetical protein
VLIIVGSGTVTRGDRVRVGVETAAPNSVSSTIKRETLEAITGGTGSCTVINRLPGALSGVAGGQAFSIPSGDRQELLAGSYVWAHGTDMGWYGMPCKAGETAIADRQLHMGDSVSVPFELRRQK